MCRIQFVFALFLLCVALRNDLVQAEEATCGAGSEKCAENTPEPSKGTKGLTRYKIQHSLGDKPEFADRGHIEVSVSKKSRKISIKFSEKSFKLTQDEVEKFKKLVETKEYYRLRIKADEKSENPKWIYASIKACVLFENQFRESFRFHLDKTGSITSFELQALNNQNQCSENLNGFPTEITIKSKASAALPKEAHIAKPEVLAKSQLKKSNLPAELQQDLGGSSLNAKNDENAEKDEKNEQPTSFLRKYWYIFLPMFLLSILNGGGAEKKD